MASQPLAFGELLFGGILLTMGLTGSNVREVLAGKAGRIKPVAAGHGGASSGSRANSAYTTAADTTAQTHGALGANGYAYPLGAGWTEERTDQGVDFAPSHTGAPIYSPGEAKVLKVGAPGWPSGEKGVLLQLLDGSLKGQVVYIYEAIRPEVSAGQIVKAGQQVGHGVFGETGIEIGFANTAGEPLSHGEYTEGAVTVWGTKMKEWLQKLRSQPKATASALGRGAAETLGWKGISA